MGNSLFKNQSGVGRLLFILALALSTFHHQSAFAEKKTTEQTDAEKEAASYKYRYETYLKTCEPLEGDEKLRCEREARAILRGASASDIEDKSCKVAYEAYAKSVSEMNEACNKAGLTGCYEKAMSCSDCLNETPDSERYTTDACNELDDTAFDEDDDVTMDDVQRSVEAITNPLGGFGRKPKKTRVTPNLKKLKGRYAKCPMLSEVDLQNLIKDVHQSESKVQDLERDLIKAQEELKQMESDYESKEAELKDAARGIMEKLESKVQQLMDQMDSISKSIKEAISQMTSEISKAQAALMELRVQENDVHRLFDQNVAKLKMKCHTSAVAEVAALRQEKQDEIRASRHSTDKINNLFRNVGLNSREQAQQMVADRERLCRQSPVYDEDLKEVARQRDSALERINKDRDVLKGKIAEFEGEIKQLKNSLPDEAQRIVEKIEAEEKKAQQAIKSLEETAVRLFKNFQNKMQAAHARIGQLQQRLATERDYVTQKHNYLALKQEYAKDGASESSESKSIPTAISRAADVHADALRVEANCCCDPMASRESQGYCTKARTHLKQKGIEMCPEPEKKDPPATVPSSKTTG